MKPFESESQRYEYDLTPESVVVDCGAYKGEFTKEIVKRYGCRVIAFEPCVDFYLGICSLEKLLPKVLVFHLAVSDENGLMRLNVRGDSTGQFRLSDDHEICGKVDLAPFLAELNITSIDLLKLNIEGEEYAVLEKLVDSGNVSRFKNILVQFHDCVPLSGERYSVLSDRLRFTHEMTWGSPFLWENWRLKP